MALSLVVCVLAGACLAIQAPLNGELGRQLGHPLLAATVSFAAGLVILIGLTLALGLRPTPGAASTAPWHVWVAGGALGVGFIATATALTPRLGTATVLSLAITGQLLTALLVDRFGWLGLTARPLTLTRVAGVALLLIGAALVVRR